jgi:hypothetical protein
MFTFVVGMGLPAASTGVLAKKAASAIATNVATTRLSFMFFLLADPRSREDGGLFLSLFTSETASAASPNGPRRQRARQRGNLYDDMPRELSS